MIDDALRRRRGAARAIDLVVRGICCLRPGRARAVGEHPRALDRRPLPRALADLPLRRADPRTAEYLIGSADLMPRNLDRRVEAMLPRHRAAPAGPARRDPRAQPRRRRARVGARRRRHLAARSRPWSASTRTGSCGELADARCALAAAPPMLERELKFSPGPSASGSPTSTTRRRRRSRADAPDDDQLAGRRTSTPPTSGSRAPARACATATTKAGR